MLLANENYMKVLIVEDDLVSAKFLSSTLSPIGEIKVAKNGREGYESFCDALENGVPFDLIFLDVMMPEVDGHEALDAIRSFETDHGVPSGSEVKVVMTTALNDAQNIYVAHSSGCTDYLVKPLSKERIYKALRKFGYLKES